MTLPSRYWRLRIESEDSFSDMLRASVARSTDPQFAQKVAPGDGICLSSYDQGIETGIVRAIGIVLNLDELSGEVKVNWANIDFTLKPNPGGRRYWKDRPYFAFADSVIDRYGLPTAFSEKFPELLKPNPIEEIPEQTIPIFAPDKYFKLDISGGPSITPAHLLPHMGRIYTGAEWESFGLTPYSIKTVYADSNRESFGFGSFQIDGYWFGFTPMVELPKDLLRLPEFEQERIALKEWTAAIKQKRRHVSVPSDVYFLRKMAVPYDEISNLTEYDRLYTEGRLAMDRDDYPAAVGFFEVADRLNPNDARCMEFLFEARVKTGDLGVIEEGLAYFANDMDCAVHMGSAEKWLRLTMDIAEDYRLTFEVALKTIWGVDALIAGKTDKAKRIYSPQRISNYKTKRDQFIKRLGTLRGFLSKPLIEANRDRAEELEMLLSQITQANPAKTKRIDELRGLLSAQH
jgi:hypothetical protein